MSIDLVNIDLQNALRLVRALLAVGQTLEDAVNNPAMPAHLRDQVRLAIEQERRIIPPEPTVLVGRSRERSNWLNEEDRLKWYYWPRLREFLLDAKGWPEAVVRSIDNATDRILGQMDPPERTKFDVRGLVLGYVQSGKTANFSALIAKAVDVGYRLIIVLSGIHNSLRQQTQRRLEAELVGSADSRPGTVRLPPVGKWWVTYTSGELDGDFEPGLGNYGPLQGTQPVLMVIKKNAAVLRKLHSWLDSAPQHVRDTLPALIIDDEADLASINVGGDQPPAEDDTDEEADTTPPSVINGLIRQLLNKFSRTAYVAYTATPFANVLIRHDAIDARAGQDLYPRDFIIDLPKPSGYFGAEEIFGLNEPVDGQPDDGLDIIRVIPDEDVGALSPARGEDVEAFVPSLPASLENALLDFVIAGAARRWRGNGREPATMLIHTHFRTVLQKRLTELVSDRLAELRDEWRYQREYGIRNHLEDRWINEFRPVTRTLHGERDAPFDAIEEHIGPFFEAIEVKQINSETEDILDYQRDPELKAIVVGGNRLSRGLTLEGLLISYYVRRTAMYDTLMQMGRWFGFRQGYEDVTRIYTTEELVSWFRELATVEYELRSDIQVYEKAGLTPLELAPRIWKHPAMLVTSPLKMKYATETVIEQSYAGQLLQTTSFSFDDRAFLENNLRVTRDFVARLGVPAASSGTGQPLWSDVAWQQVLEFLGEYRVCLPAAERAFPPELIRAFIRRQAGQGELTGWTVSIRGLQETSSKLGTIDLAVRVGDSVNCIARTRLKTIPNSIGVLTSPGDEETGLDDEQLVRARLKQEEEKVTRGRALRAVRPKTEGLLLIYPISRQSRPMARAARTRIPLFDDPNAGTEVIGLALSFPVSDTAATIQGTYVVGTVGWRAI